MVYRNLYVAWVGMLLLTSVAPTRANGLPSQPDRLGTSADKTFTLTEPPVTPAFWAAVAVRHDRQIKPGSNGQVIAYKNYVYNGSNWSLNDWLYPNMGRNAHEPENPTIKPQLLVYMPKGFASDGTWGLLVLDAYSDKFGIPQGWEPICKQRRLLLAVVQDAGNTHHDYWRQALIAKAYLELNGKYKLNHHRIYLVGFSGGARMVSEAAVVFSDIFKGEISNCCADYPIVNAKSMEHSHEWFLAETRYLNLARNEVRFFLFTGTKDVCETDTIMAYHHLKSLGFKYVTLFDQPGARHTQMSLQNFQRGLDYLDAPLTRGFKGKMRQVQTFEHQKQFGSALWLAQRMMDTAPGTPICNQARAIFESMRPAYTKMLSDVQTIIRKGDAHASNIAIAQFAHLYLPYARADIQKLQSQMLKAH